MLERKRKYFPFCVFLELVLAIQPTQQNSPLGCKRGLGVGMCAPKACSIPGRMGMSGCHGADAPAHDGHSSHGSPGCIQPLQHPPHPVIILTVVAAEAITSISS